MNQQTEAGFTAVELLITLFVAAVFLVAGYQLFSFVIQQGGDGRAEAKISNLSYDYLRQYDARITNPCTASMPVSNAAVTLDGVSDVRVTVTITCPNSLVSRLSKIEVRTQYNNPREEVVFSSLKNGDMR